MSVTFYDVKSRTSVEVPESDVSKTKYVRTTKEGKEQTRFALRGSYQGRNLTRFVSEADWNAFNGPVQ